MELTEPNMEDATEAHDKILSLLEEVKATRLETIFMDVWVWLCLSPTPPIYLQYNICDLLVRLTPMGEARIYFNPQEYPPTKQGLEKLYDAITIVAFKKHDSLVCGGGCCRHAHLKRM